MSEKFSDFIRAPGTAGPPTIEGIYALGFALRNEVAGQFVRVDAAQSFDAGEQGQGRENIDAQQFSASLTSLAGLTTAADRLAYTTAADTWAVTTLTSFARTILDDTNAAGVRTTIGLGNVDNTSDANKPISTATQTALDLKAPLASPALTGVPTAPTASLGTNTTQVATTAFVLANAGGIQAGTAQTATGVETSLPFGSLPAAIRRITMAFVSVSTNGTSIPIVQLGTAGGYETTGYLGAASNLTLSGVSSGNISSGFRLQNSVTAATLFHGMIILTRVTGNTWSVSGAVGWSDTTVTSLFGGSKVLSGELTQIRLTTEIGTAVFDTGSIVNILYEF